MSTIVESPVIDKGRIMKKGTNDSRSIRILLSETPPSEQNKSKIIIKKSIIKQMEKKILDLKNTDELVEKPSQNIKPEEIIVEKENTKGCGTTKHSQNIIMRITENTFIVIYSLPIL